jgi:hypothetical protein
MKNFIKAHNRITYFPCRNYERICAFFYRRYLHLNTMKNLQYSIQYELSSKKPITDAGDMSSVKQENLVQDSAKPKVI